MSSMDTLKRRVETLKALPPPSSCRELRQASGVTLEELAAALGVNKSTVSRWERGIRRPRRSIVAEYVEALEVLRG